MDLILTLKGSKVAAGAGAWIMSFVLIDLTTGQAVVAAFFALVSAVLAAWLASRPALLQARTAAEQQHVTEQAQVEARQDRMHAREVAWLQSRVEYHAKHLVLTRKSKHNLLNYAQELGDYAQRLQGVLRDAGADVPPFRFKFYDELCGEEDRALAALTLPADFNPAASGELPRG